MKRGKRSQMFFTNLSLRMTATFSNQQHHRNQPNILILCIPFINVHFHTTAMSSIYRRAVG